MKKIPLLLAFVFIFFAGEMISRSVEIFLELPNNPFNMNEFQLAFIIGAAASIPEHAIALMAVRHEGGIELGMGNLIAGSMQNLLLMTGLVALFSYVGARIGITGNSLAVHFNAIFVSAIWICLANVISYKEFHD